MTKTAIPDGFGARLRQLRLEKVGSQDALARKTGLTKTHIQSLESMVQPGDRTQYKTLAVLAEAVESSISYLLTGTMGDRRSQVDEAA